MKSSCVVGPKNTMAVPMSLSDIATVADVGTCERSLERKKNANNLVALVACVRGDVPEEVALAAIASCSRVFARFSADMHQRLGSDGHRPLKKRKTTEGDVDVAADEPALQKFAGWLKVRLRDFVDAAVLNVQNGPVSVRDTSLKALVCILKEESRNGALMFCSPSKDFVFPVATLERIASAVMLTSQGEWDEQYLQRVLRLLEYDDVRYFFLRALK